MMKMVELSAPPEVIIFSDASGNWGYWAIWDTHWLQWEWDSSCGYVKELVPIVATIHLTPWDVSVDNPSNPTVLKIHLT